MKTFLSLLAGAVLALAANAQNATDATGLGSKGALETRDHGNVQSQDGILRAQGSIIYLKKGVPNRVTYEMKLSEGLTVRPNGDVILPDGKTINLQEGQMVTLDGKLTTAPKGLGSTTPGAAGTQPPETGAKTDFGNAGGDQSKKK